MTLPQDIIQQILDELQDIEDVICLGLTCSKMWDSALAEICEWTMHESMTTPTWARQPIVCVGEALGEDDYPPGLFSQDEIQELKECPVYDEKRTERYGNDDEEAWYWAMQIGYFAFEEVSEEVDESILPYVQIDKKLCKLSRDGRLDASFDKVAEQLFFGLFEYTPEDEPWVLVNLTTRQFVRAEAIALKPEYIHGPWIEKIGFVNVILMRTFWGCTDTSYLKHFDLQSRLISRRGKWAGNKFMVVTLSYLEDLKQRSDREWTDVSGEVGAEIDTLWTKRFGSNWREIICAPGFKYKDPEKPADYYT